jgi:hypothetical protein
MKKHMNSKEREQAVKSTYFAGTFGGPGDFLRREEKKTTGGDRGVESHREKASPGTYRPSGTLC